MPGAIAQALGWIAEQAARYQIKVSANLLVTDGHQLVATRWAWGTAAPSLYVSQTANSVAIASEPLGDDRPWQPVPMGTLWIAADQAWHEGPALPR